MASVRINLQAVCQLPAVCVCCGKPATATRDQVFECATALTPLLTAAAAAVGYLSVHTRQITLTLPVCQEHTRLGRKSDRVFFRGIGMTVLVGVLAWLVSLIDETAGTYVAIAALGVFIITCFHALSLSGDELKAESINQAGVSLVGVCKEFARAVKDNKQ